MQIGCPKEIKNNENRVGLTPNAVQAYVQAGHRVFIERGAGLGSAIEDQEYLTAGATMLPSAEEVWNAAEMIVKVKEPLPDEYGLMRENQLIYTYFHFAADEELTRVCLERKIIALAYETVQEGTILPLLKPMSEVAGLNTRVTILDINLNRLDYLDDIMPPNVTSIYNDPVSLENHLKTADIVIGAVLVPGAKAPKLIRREHLKIMKPGSVIVDVAIDQGGCCETSRPTTHSDPTFVVDDVIHYCVANMPGAYARTSTYALGNATIRYGLLLANEGVEKACRNNAALKLGLNLYKGRITYPSVAGAFDLMRLYTLVDQVLA